MRDETITQNLIRLMKREVIKQQCWDSMAVKGRCIEVFLRAVRKSREQMGRGMPKRTHLIIRGRGSSQLIT